ncbi:MAG: HAD-IIIA family hydrolase, partial [Bdellovibrio sp.]|nr:HAD-IIIA family hydrolase [Bdellovibrio sp.]
MKSWAQLVADTVRLGGSLVFIEESAPANLAEWIGPLTKDFALRIPVLRRSAQSLQARRYQTRPQDLVFFFEGQEGLLDGLDSVLQGQRVWITAKDQGPHNVDYVWQNVTQGSWDNFWQSLLPQFESLLENWSADDVTGSPCLFLDRDDVLVKNVPYNRDADQVMLIPGAVDLIRRAHEKGYWVGLVTNQSGIGRGRISWAEYQQVHQRMLKLLAQQGAWIDECVWSSFIENESVPEGRILAGLRKPRAGMFQLVREKLKVDMTNSLMVGDSATDLIAAFSAGVGSCYLFHSEKFDKERAILENFKKHQSRFD